MKVGQNTSPTLLHKETKERKEYNRHSQKLQDNTSPINTESVCQKEKRERMELIVHSLTNCSRAENVNISATNQIYKTKLFTNSALY